MNLFWYFLIGLKSILLCYMLIDFVLVHETASGNHCAGRWFYNSTLSTGWNTENDFFTLRDPLCETRGVQ